MNSLLAAEVLAQVPGAGAVAHPQVQPLRGGLTNRSFLVTTPRGRFVVRLGTHADAQLAIDRGVETTVQRLAAAAGLAPRIVHADAASGLLIAEYVAGRGWTADDFAAAAQIDRLAARLRCLHAIDASAARTLVSFDAVGAARGYVERIAATSPDERERLEQLLARAVRVQRITGAWTRTPTLVHSDLHGSNIVDGDELWLIDWEYATLADPLQDVACVLAYYPAAQVHAARLLAALGLERDVTPAALRAAVWLFQLLVFLWYRARRVVTAPAAAERAAERRARDALVHNGRLHEEGREWQC